MMHRSMRSALSASHASISDCIACLRLAVGSHDASQGLPVPGSTPFQATSHMRLPCSFFMSTMPRAS
eukprot:2069874-Prymnesium_polylepis.1